MDAKPQRPQRAPPPPAHGNENAPPVKTSIHQRHKSAVNLKTVIMTGALNAPPKRTAFGDVSNVVRSIVDYDGKDASKGRVKSVIAAVTSRELRVEDKENSRATAQSKYLSNGPVSTALLGQAAKPALRSNVQYSQQHIASAANPLVKPGPAKKVATIYQDKKDRNVAVRPEVGASVDDLLALVDKQIKNPRHYKSQPQLKLDQPVLRRTQSKYLHKADKLVEVEDGSDLPDDATEVAYEDAVERLSKEFEASIEEDLVGGADLIRSVQAEAVVEQHVTTYSDIAQSHKSLPAAPITSEPEEYWDEDEEQDLYDEQGFTTAHSYRSHGDNTTGGVTTVVAPKVTANIKKELERALHYVQETQTEEELEEEAWDVSMVAEYGDEIFAYMRTLEANMLPNPHYMDIQTEIQWSMRSVLMDWLVQVHHRFSLLPETLFLTVNYIDRFLSVKVVSLGKLQLVGATAMFLAAKYEEINCPSVQEIVYMVDSGYSIEEILKAERFMLSMLQFELGWPGPMSFLRRISKADDYDLETRTLAKYFLEITIMDERFVGSPPSFIAAGAHCLARMFLAKGDWTLAHVHYSGYTMSQLKPLVTMLLECCQDPRRHHGAVFDKYSGPRYKYSSTFVEEKMVKGFKLPLPALPQAARNSSPFEEESRLTKFEPLIPQISTEA